MGDLQKNQTCTKRVRSPYKCVQHCAGNPAAIEKMGHQLVMSGKNPPGSWRGIYWQRCCEVVLNLLEPKKMRIYYQCAKKIKIPLKNELSWVRFDNIELLETFIPI